MPTLQVFLMLSHSDFNYAGKVDCAQRNNVSNGECITGNEVTLAQMRVEDIQKCDNIFTGLFSKSRHRGHTVFEITG